MREFYYLREFRYHPHITKLYEIIFTETSVYMILEYYPSGDLFEYVTKNGKLSVDESLRIFTQTLGAVLYLHKNGCCHRDLKLENVLLDKKMNVKLSDFGFTRELPFVQHGSKSLLSEYCGTGAYMAPEIVKRTPYSGIKIDIWALGVMLYTMLTGEMPFDDSLDSNDLEYAIVNEIPRFFDCFESLDVHSTDKLQQIKMLLSDMLAKEADDRISSLEDVLRLPLFASYGGIQQIDIVNKLLFDSSNIRHDWSDLTGTEKTLFKNLVNAGIDREILKRAIREETLDSVYGMWTLLNNQIEKKEKRSKKSKRRSVLKLSRSRSLLGNARQAFSSSPIQTEPAISNGGVSSIFLSRTGSSKKLENSCPPESGQSLKRTGSLTKSKKLLGNNEKVNSATYLNSIVEKDDNKQFNDQASVLSKSTQFSNKSKGSETSKKKRHFSLLNIFKPKNNKESNKIGLFDSTVYKPTLQETKTDSFVNSVLTKSRSGNDGSIQQTSTASNRQEDATPLTITFSIGSEDNVLMTPDQSRLKRSKPTRPSSVFSDQTSASETSQGSGYITGYSTDMNIFNANATNDMLSVSRHNSDRNVNDKGNNNDHCDNEKNDDNNNDDNVNQIDNSISNTSLTFKDQLQLVSSPKTNTRAKFSRGISDWSVNVSSQAESPNSSFVALSRTNSIDSVSRSISSIKKNKTKNLNSINSMRRGRSPLNSKMNAKWDFNNTAVKKTKRLFTKEERQNQIIEEETSEQELDEEDDDDDFVSKNTANFNRLRPNHHDTPIESGRLYMRKKSMKFPILPVTEENDQDLEFEDEADVEEDNHDYDDVATELSDQDYSRPDENGNSGCGGYHSFSLESRESSSLSGINDKINTLSVNERTNGGTLLNSKQGLLLNIPRKRNNDHLLSSPIEGNERLVSPIPRSTITNSQYIVKTLEDSVQKKPYSA
jgi:serine/threonine protein kinase